MSVEIDSCGRSHDLLEVRTASRFVLPPYIDATPVPPGYWRETASLRRTMRRVDSVGRKKAAA